MYSTLPLWAVLALLVGSFLAGVLSAATFPDVRALVRGLVFVLRHRLTFWRERDRAVAFWISLSAEERQLVGDAVATERDGEVDPFVRMCQEQGVKSDGPLPDVYLKLVRAGGSVPMSGSFLTTLEVWAEKERTDPAPFDPEVTPKRVRRERLMHGSSGGAS